MIRKIDELGRIVLPAEMRTKLHLEKEDAVNIDCVDDKIILSKAKATCVICHSSENELLSVDHELVCSECIQKIKSLW
ncbi:MAG: AbrB/MazE/SpoVT family DNA-binding domain-containing protein [Eubacteriales bacterium]|nr:AbrB/MazE/SpoVT family DNA-binding domain-containing protein [Eubacteriales bacterium]MDD4474351.1 AbrB/MazE/SpoVT family DNA-binding domain-containing protein [Eubacteriales bacterium]